MSLPFRLEATRGGVPESVHRVSVAVVDRAGRVMADSGDPGLVAFWRSAAKPFQGMPMVAEGAADRFGFTAKELALACASHSSEPAHLEVVDGMLRKIGLGEESLACGPHPPLSPVIADQVLRHGTHLTPRWSNCSGKHAGMLAQALAHGWPVAGYERLEHPLQQRILREVERWTDVPAAGMALGVDGCTVVSFGLPLRAMALAYARFGVSEDSAAARLRAAMSEFPEMVGGRDRFCTDLGQAARGKVFAKLGADGVYCAAIPGPGLGVALKVEDGDMRCLGPALLGVLRSLAARLPLGFDPGGLGPAVDRHAELPIVNTRGARTGVLRTTGGLRFSA
jgi:L-asparaginase II